MAVLQTDSKCSNTNVYAPLSNRFAPCPWTLSTIFKIASNIKVIFVSLGFWDKSALYKL
jgi:hypothetical protein